MFTQLLKNAFITLNPRTLPSLLGIAGKAAMGWVLIQCSTLVKFVLQEEHPYTIDPLYTEIVEQNPILHFFTFSGFLLRTGQALLLDAAIDLSKILIINLHQSIVGLKNKYSYNVILKKLELAVASKGTLTGNAKNRRKALSDIETEILGLNKKIDQIKTLMKKDKLSYMSVTKQDKEILEKYSLWMSMLFETLTNIYMLFALVEPLQKFMISFLSSGSDDLLHYMEDKADILKQRDPYAPLPPNLYTQIYLFNYMFSSNLAITITLIRVFINQIDFKNRFNLSKLIGNIPIIGFFNNLGFKFNSFTTVYELNRTLILSSILRNRLLKYLEDNSTIKDNELSQILLTEALRMKAKIGGNLSKYSSKEEMAKKLMVDIVNRLDRHIQKKVFLMDIASYLSLWGSYKIYKVVLHIGSNVVDLYQQGGILPTKAIDRLTERLAIVQERTTAQQLKQDREPLPASQNVFAVSYQAKNVVFPPHFERETPKTRARSTDTTLQNASNSDSLESFPKVAPVNPEDCAKEIRRNQILAYYQRCDKDLLRRILERRLTETHKDTAENQVLKLARDLHLDIRKTGDGYLILVYGQHGASFHIGHGKDRAQHLSRKFFSELSDAFHLIGITSTVLDIYEEELMVRNTCANVLDMITYTLTERPKV